MRDEVGEDFRAAFLEMLEVAGTKCDEFAAEVGDRFMEIAAETRFDVADVESVSVAGVFQCFEVTTERVA